MFKVEAGYCHHPANSWSRVADTIATTHVDLVLESLPVEHIRVLLIEVLEDYKSFKIVVETLDRLEKILEI